MVNTTDTTGRARRQRAVPIDEATRRRLAKLVAELGEQEVIRRMNLPGQTLARAVAGFDLYRGTIALIHGSLATLEKELAGRSAA